MDYTEKLERIILELLDELEEEHLGAWDSMRDGFLREYGLDVNTFLDKHRKFID